MCPGEWKRGAGWSKGVLDAQKGWWWLETVGLNRVLGVETGPSGSKRGVGRCRRFLMGSNWVLVGYVNHKIAWN